MSDDRVSSGSRPCGPRVRAGQVFLVEYRRRFASALLRGAAGAGIRDGGTGRVGVSSLLEIDGADLHWVRRGGVLKRAVVSKGKSR